MRTSTAAILASDFTHDTTDVNRHRWTVGKMRHLMAALNGTRVVITTDRMTGHTLLSARILDVYGHPFKGDQVEIEIEYERGKTQRTAYRLVEVGPAIIPLTATQAKWDALRSYSDEGSEAVRQAQADHGDAEGRSWGKWTATPGSDYVFVTYEPHTGNPHFADKWGERGYWKYPASMIVRSVTR